MSVKTDNTIGKIRSYIKITFLGVGSTVFARNILGDCMCSKALRNCEIALYDIDKTRLEESFSILNRINEGLGGRTEIKKYIKEINSMQSGEINIRNPGVKTGLNYPPISSIRKRSES